MWVFTTQAEQNIIQALYKLRFPLYIYLPILYYIVAGWTSWTWSTAALLVFLMETKSLLKSLLKRGWTWSLLLAAAIYFCGFPWWCSLNFLTIAGGKLWRNYCSTGVGFLADAAISNMPTEKAKTSLERSHIFTFDRHIKLQTGLNSLNGFVCHILH